MPVKKLIRDLKSSLKRERETQRKSQLGILWGRWKCSSIEKRIGELNRELEYRKSKSKTEEK